MSNPGSDPGQDDREARLRALEERIRQAKGVDEVKETSSDGMGQGELAWRMVIELLAGILIGFGIGYGLDTLFGTKPFLIIVFIFLGLAAGIKTMLGSAKEMQDKWAAEQAARDEDETRGG